jgi:hypothetical protein
MTGAAKYDPNLFSYKAAETMCPNVCTDEASICITSSFTSYQIGEDPLKKYNVLV